MPHLGQSPLPVTDQLFRFAVTHRTKIIQLFKLYYLFLIFLTLAGGYSSYFITRQYLIFYTIGVLSGKIGLIFYVLTTIPGIARRFGLTHKLIAILMIFRRYTGIAMFLGILSHYVILRFAAMLRTGLPTITTPVFEVVGLSAFLLATLLFLTSNDFSVRYLKTWWNWIHKLTYIIIWLIVLHLLLQRISIWSVTIGFTALMQILSYFYSRLKNSSVQLS